MIELSRRGGEVAIDFHLIGCRIVSTVPQRPSNSLGIIFECGKRRGDMDGLQERHVQAFVRGPDKEFDDLALFIVFGLESVEDLFQFFGCGFDFGAVDGHFSGMVRKVSEFGGY